MNKKIKELLEQATWPGAPQLGIEDAIDYEHFAHLIAEECAKVAEQQARVYTGENNEAAGCHGAATAIRTVFGKCDE